MWIKKIEQFCMNTPPNNKQQQVAKSKTSKCGEICKRLKALDESAKTPKMQLFFKKEGCGVKMGLTVSDVVFQKY